jgi:FixJ family two-component response regulator
MPRSTRYNSVSIGDVHEYIEAMNPGAFDFIAPSYRISEIISVVDGAYRCYRLKQKDESVLYHPTEELCRAASPY